jgi:hypothetical protein
MGQITAAHAYANSEVAYIAWDIDGKIEGYLGFDVTRVYLNADGTVARAGWQNGYVAGRKGALMRYFAR